MICHQCGLQGIPVGTQFCPRCGAEFRLATASAPAFALAFDRLIEQAAADFTGREWLFTDIGHWLVNPDGRPIYLLTGDPGSGKTAIAARLVQFLRGEATAPLELTAGFTGVLGAVHFCSAREGLWINPLTFSESIATQLVRDIDFAAVLVALLQRQSGGTVGPQQIVHQTVSEVKAGGQVIGVINNIKQVVAASLNPWDAFNSLIRQPLEEFSRLFPERRVLVLVDGLDEALSYGASPTINGLLGNMGELPNGVRFLLTSRDEPLVTESFLDVELLFLSAAEYDQTNRDELEDYVRDRFQQDGALQELTAEVSLQVQETAITTIRDKASGNFRYAVFLLKALAAHSQTFDTLGALPAGLDGLYFESLDRLVKQGKRTWEGDYAPILGLLSIAQTPLTEKQLDAYGWPTTATRRAFQATLDLQQFLDVAYPAGEAADGEIAYQLFHQSVADFLTKGIINVQRGGRTDRVKNRYWLEAADWHQQIATVVRGSAGGWDSVNWGKIAGAKDLYPLHHLVPHLYFLRDTSLPESPDSTYRAWLHELLHSKGYLKARRASGDRPSSLPSDLRLGLGLALEYAEFVEAWQYLATYRQVQQSERAFQLVQRAVDDGRYTEALERTVFHAYLPNSQALERLWIAWRALSAGSPDIAEEAVRAALSALPPRGFVAASTAEADASAPAVVADAIQEATARLLRRLEIDAGDDWLLVTAGDWLAQIDPAIWTRLQKPLESWGEAFDAGAYSTPIDHVLNDLKARGIDANENFRSANSFFQGPLAAAVFNFRTDLHWLDHLQQAVDHIALDDYPSYREMALAWVFSSALAHPEPGKAQEAAAIILTGIFKPVDIGFLGETVVAVLGGYRAAHGQAIDPQHLLYELEKWEVATQQEVYLSLGAKPEDLLIRRQQLGLPDDPWASELRRRSAVAGALWRQGEKVAGRQWLEAAGASNPAVVDRSYAGYRCLARLSLACRWLEWGDILVAQEQVDLAAEDATNMLDRILRREREYLVHQMAQRINGLAENPQPPGLEPALEEVQTRQGLDRFLFLEFLAALWAGWPEQLARLLPLALDDVTATDAVFGRLLSQPGVEAAQFDGLLTALRLEMPELVS